MWPERPNPKSTTPGNPNRASLPTGHPSPQPLTKQVCLPATPHHKCARARPPHLLPSGCGGNHVKCNNGVCGSTFPSTTPAPQQPASNRQWSYLGR
jgi:hypothetical protein